MGIPPCRRTPVATESARQRHRLSQVFADGISAKDSAKASGAEGVKGDESRDEAGALGCIWSMCGMFFDEFNVVHFPVHSCDVGAVHSPWEDMDFAAPACPGTGPTRVSRSVSAPSGPRLRAFGASELALLALGPLGEAFPTSGSCKGSLGQDVPGHLSCNFERSSNRFSLLQRSRNFVQASMKLGPSVQASAPPWSSCL